MVQLLYLVVFSCLLKASLQKSTPQDSEYVAAVVEYQVSRNVEENLRNYIEHITEAAKQGADIIAFPELTLTNSTTSFPVPIKGLLREYPIPALHPELYDNLLVAISKAARDNQIYVLVNIRELMDCTHNDTGELCPEAKKYTFNTNVVFDRTGKVIDRYRKINLFGEASHTPALQPDLGYFETDFGVNFSHFICFDLMFQVPAVQSVQKLNVTNIIFSTMWFSELPYLTAVQIQESYAYTMNVNFIASGANNIAVGSAGSGIYSGKAGALISIMPGVPTTRLLVSRVPKVPGQVTGSYPGPIYDKPDNHDRLRLITDPSLVAHVSRPLTSGYQQFTLTEKDVSCKFTVKMSPGIGESYYRYRAAVFSGVRSFSGKATGGAKVCTIVACTGDAMNTCGKRFENYAVNRTAVFDELNIIGTMPSPVRNPQLQADGFVMYPVSVIEPIMPLEPKGFTFTATTANTTTVYNYSLVNLDAKLYAFTLWGRYFATDGQDATPPVPDSATAHLLSGVLLVFLLLRSVIAVL
ncbi:vanin-like protein 2 isoform X2 [Manduca sexta]|uniref:vanin-like protein 2 isoform X2 n=1 Tax=Manduca sexta TaxID=7130 RepID=UPI00188F4051|nr:vanin-like protein 2 isoform X2 [Manduca sexta]